MRYKYKINPYKYQQNIIESNLSMDYAALFMEMGTGKSKIMIDTAGALYEAGKIQRVLIIGNNGSYANWVNKEIPQHLPDRIPRACLYWKQATGKKWDSLLDAFRARRQNALLFFAVNVEATIVQRVNTLLKNYVSTADTLVIIDESSTIKNHKAQRTKQVIKIARRAKYRRILTGTPIGNGPLDLYSQCEALDYGCLGFSSYYSFRSFYSIMKEIRPRGLNGRSVKVVVGYQETNKLKEDLSRFSFIVKKSDCLDLPEKVYQTYEVELTPEQTKLYKEMARDAVTEIEGQIVSAPVILTKILKLHQLTCGIIKPDEGNPITIKNNRIKALESVLNEMEPPVVIWANYRQNIKDIMKFLGDDCRGYYGDTSDQERVEIVKLFQEKGIKYLVANPQSAGYGLTLTAGHNAVYYSNNYSAEHRQQSEDRLHRIGQENKVLYVDLVCIGSIDEKILKILKNKKNIATELLSTPDGWRDYLTL